MRGPCGCRWAAKVVVMQGLVKNGLAHGPETGAANFRMVCNPAEFGGPSRGRTYGPLMKSPVENFPQDTRDEQSLANMRKCDGEPHHGSSCVRLFWHQVGTNRRIFIVLGWQRGRPASLPVCSAFSAMLNHAIFKKSDFPAMALVVCSKEELTHTFDRLSPISGRRPQRWV